MLPICLPGSELFPDEKGEVYVAHWGYVAEENCTTGKYGLILTPFVPQTLNTKINSTLSVLKYPPHLATT